MPTLHKKPYQVGRHIKLINKNLCANLIKHDYIVTGRTKAKRAQAKIESFLSNALQKDRELQKQNLSLKERLEQNENLNYLQPGDKNQIAPRVIEELSKRYPERKHGFTRIIKLEPRLGDDKAPMSVLELVDSEFEIRFWYIAKVVARLELQGLPVDDLTKVNIKKLTQLREDGEDKFRSAVETAKEKFFHYDPVSGEITNEESKKNLENLPHNLEYYGGAYTGQLTVSKKFNVIPRPNKTQPTEEKPESS
ncbi:ribosomal protein L17 [Hyphopichia burtonii NRRL Y-1933]|uniref:Ribosomal protein L17 n=1 Tax=Hyphopichia burtonii NRRL Y-1933 TaxID=984485 RepID=A0A1E4RIU2_9ASCO|nr:ribosomal protein L17 [Hyphopichia burtonii NRRL Y-1933]ODV67187.1 ribosomal protein L17 [Hyphopichia burtonii NRRL Y-1933]